MSNEPQGNSVPCTECQAGHMHRQFVTFLTWLEDDLITVPDFPAWVCDVCGRRDYDGHALNQLSLLLNPNAGRSSLRSRSPGQKPSSKTSRPSRSE